jgi:putrescine carbamoyltransferase
MCDVIEARTLKHKTVTDLAKYATIPVINGLTDYNHPTQVICDVLTMIEHAPDGKKLEDLNVTFIGDATNVLSSLMLICTRLGINFTHAAPKQYQAPEEWMKMARANCAVSGGKLTVTDDPVQAVQNADFIYNDLWWWVGQEAQIPERKAAFMPDFQVNLTLFNKAPDHCKFMHCLPASRGVEVTDEVMDHPRSVVFDQSENRLHTEKGLLVYFVYHRLPRPSAELRVMHQEKIEDFLQKKNIQQRQ